MKFLRKNRKAMVMVLAVFLGIGFAFAVMAASPVFASEAAGNDAMPWENALNKIVNSITGPVAIGVSMIAIVAAGIALVFGGDMQGFMRQAAYLALVIGVIVMSGNLLKSMYGKSDFITSLF